MKNNVERIELKDVLLSVIYKYRFRIKDIITTSNCDLISKRRLNNELFCLQILICRLLTLFRWYHKINKVLKDVNDTIIRWENINKKIVRILKNMLESMSVVDNRHLKINNFVINQDNFITSYSLYFKLKVLAFTHFGDKIKFINFDREKILVCMIPGMFKTELTVSKRYRKVKLLSFNIGSFYKIGCNVEESMKTFSQGYSYFDISEERLSSFFLNLRRIYFILKLSYILLIFKKFMFEFRFTVIPCNDISATLQFSEEFENFNQFNVCLSNESIILHSFVPLSNQFLHTESEVTSNLDLFFLKNRTFYFKVITEYNSDDIKNLLQNISKLLVYTKVEKIATHILNDLKFNQAFLMTIKIIKNKIVVETDGRRIITTIVDHEGKAHILQTPLLSLLNKHSHNIRFDINDLQLCVEGSVNLVMYFFVAALVGNQTFALSPPTVICTPGRSSSFKLCLSQSTTNYINIRMYPNKIELYLAKLDGSYIPIKSLTVSHIRDILPYAADCRNMLILTELEDKLKENNYLVSRINRKLYFTYKQMIDTEISINKDGSWKIIIILRGYPFPMTKRIVFFNQNFCARFPIFILTVLRNAYEIHMLVARASFLTQKNMDFTLENPFIFSITHGKYKLRAGLEISSDQEVITYENTVLTKITSRYPPYIFTRLTMGANIHFTFSEKEFLSADTYRSFILSGFYSLMSFVELFKDQNWTISKISNQLSFFLIYKQRYTFNIQYDLLNHFYIRIPNSGYGAELKDLLSYHREKFANNQYKAYIIHFNGFPVFKRQIEDFFRNK